MLVEPPPGTRRRRGDEREAPVYPSGRRAAAAMSWKRLCIRGDGAY